MSRDRLLISATFSRVPRNGQAAGRHRSCVWAGVWLLQGCSGHTPSASPDAGSAAVLHGHCEQQGHPHAHLGTGALAPGAGTAAGATHSRLLLGSLARLAEWSSQAQLGQPGPPRWTPKDSYFSPDLGSVLTLSGLCHLMLLLKVSPRILV